MAHPTRWLVPVLGLLLVLLAPAPMWAQDATAEDQIARHRLQNRVRALEGSTEALKKELQIRYNKEKTSRTHDKKTGTTTEVQIVDRKQPILYDKAIQVALPMLEKAFRDEKNLEAKIKHGEKLEAFLQRMKDLFGTDTEKLEKKLKKETDPQVVHDLIMAR